MMNQFHTHSVLTWAKSLFALQWTELSALLQEMEQYYTCALIQQFALFIVGHFGKVKRKRTFLYVRTSICCTCLSLDYSVCFGSCFDVETNSGAVEP
jgi:hypothetical protein